MKRLTRICVYIKNTNKSYVFVYLYVGNMLNLDNSEYLIKPTKKILTNKFDMKEM